MIPFKLSEAALAVGGRLYEGSDDIEITRLFTDSRQAGGGGGLFFALRGDVADGHDYLNGVFKEGNAAFVDRPECFVKNTVLVKNVKSAIYDLAFWYRSKVIPNVKTVCITGSVGKTTTKDMAGLVFAKCANSYVTGGNRNSLIGLPLSVTDVEPQHEYAVLELGMSERGEIERLSLLAKPYISAITTVGSSHLEALGTVENIKNEKFDILKGQANDGKTVLNADNPLEYEEGLKLGDRAVFCSVLNSECDFFARDIVDTDDGVSFVVCNNNTETPVTLKVSGRHNVSNSLLVFALGACCGFPFAKIAEALGEYKPHGNRQNKYEKDGITVIADCYNASPESMFAALDVLNSANGRKIAVLGDMLELGKNTVCLHERVGIKASECADCLIFVGDMAEVYKGSCGRACKTYGVSCKIQAAEYLKSLVRPGDTVLFKASNRLKFEEIIEKADLKK